MVKRLLKALYIALLAQKWERKAFKAAKYHLRRGVYCCPLGQKKFCKIGAKGFLPKNISHIHINFKNKGAHNSVEFGTGYGKAVVLTEDKAYGYYYKKTGYKQAKENFESFYKDFNYPCVTGVSFCDSCLRETMNREKGTVYADENHDRIVITGMLKFLSEAKTKEKNGKILFLQHADANRVNVLWEKDEKFVFIDLDNIEYYPPHVGCFSLLCRKRI